MTRLEEIIKSTCEILDCGACPFHVKSKDFCAFDNPYSWEENAERGDKERHERNQSVQHMRK